MKCGRRSFSGTRTREARIDQGQEVAAIKPLEEPEWRAPRGLERTVPDEPASVQGLSTQRESRRAMGLQISRGHAELSRAVDGPYLLKESLAGLWDYKYPGAMLNYLGRWMDRLKWQRLAPFEELADMLLKHLEGIVNYCRTKVRFGVVEAVNGNIRMLINRGRGYKNLRYLLLKAKRMAVTNVEFLAVQRVKKVA